MASTGPALWPGTSTFPNTNVFPGQGDRPLWRLYASFDDVTIVEPSWTDLSSRIRSLNIRKGRNSELDEVDAGTLSAVLDNRDRPLDSVTQPTVTPMNRIMVFSEFDGIREMQFFGYAEAWQQNWDQSGIVDAAVTLSAADEFKPLSRFEYAVSGTGVSNVSLAINNILDVGGPNHAPRRIGTAATGSSLTYPGTSTPLLTAIQDTVRSENNGAGPSIPQVQVFFTAKDGYLTYLEAGHRSRSPYDTVQATYGDAGGSELPYLNLTVDYSDAFLFNSWTVNGTSGTSGTSSGGASSIARYGTRTATRDVLYDAATGGVGNTVASELRSNYDQPMLRIMSLQPQMEDDETCSKSLGLDLMDRIRVLRTPPGGGSRIDQTLFVQSIEITAMPGVPPIVTLGVSPL